MQLLFPSIPEISVQERRDALVRASEFAPMQGVTTVVDMGRYFPGASPELLWENLSDVYEWADHAGKMTIKVCLFFPLETWSRLTDLIQRRGQMLSEWIYLGGSRLLLTDLWDQTVHFFMSLMRMNPKIMVSK